MNIVTTGQIISYRGVGGGEGIKKKIPLQEILLMIKSHCKKISGKYFFPQNLLVHSLATCFESFEQKKFL